MRLQKYLAEAGVASRRASEALIEAGRVSVNGETARLGMSVEDGDTVLLDGKPVVKREQRTVLLFYKPRGVVCTSDDPEGRKTVQDFFSDIPVRLFNVGRLDLNSEGLLLMTNDGELAYYLTHPRYGAEKTYYAVLDGVLTEDEAERLRCGVRLDDGMTAPAVLTHIARTARGDTSLLMTIHEGRNRQIRRMAEAVGHKTLRLKRERFGIFSLGTLEPGQWRYATAAELSALDRSIDTLKKGDGVSVNKKQKNI